MSLSDLGVGLDVVPDIDRLCPHEIVMHIPLVVADLDLQASLREEMLVRRHGECKAILETFFKAEIAVLGSLRGPLVFRELGVLFVAIDLVGV